MNKKKRRICLEHLVEKRDLKLQKISIKIRSDLNLELLFKYRT